MKYRLTYALNREDIVTIEFESHAHDLVGAFDEAFELIEKEHGAEAVMNLVAVSLLKSEVPNGTPN